MNNDIKLQESFAVSSATLYHAWLNSEEHTKMTGGDAKCSPIINTKFFAWDGYITGKNIELIENKKIVQTWRTTEFKEKDKDSKLTIELTETAEGCILNLNHTNIPEGNSDYKKGWVDSYFTPMKAYFNK